MRTYLGSIGGLPLYTRILFSFSLGGDLSTGQGPTGEPRRVFQLDVTVQTAA